MSTTEAIVADVVAGLTRRHPFFDRRKIEQLVAEVYDSYRFAPVQAYVPILTHHEIDTYLRDLERGGPVAPGPRPRRLTDGSGPVVGVRPWIAPTAPDREHRIIGA